MDLNVIYEDNHIIVVEKIAGLPTQADSSGDIDMYNLVKTYIKNKYNKPGDAFVGIVHRLDRPVGGLMVLAKTSKGASRLSEQIRNRTFIKTYLAILNGMPENESGTLENYLLKDKKKNIVSVVSGDKAEAKKANLEYKVIKRLKDNKTLVEINLHTGRPHQIRVQFANIGCPLVGDNKYGNNNREGTLKLWAYKLEFKHPTKDDVMYFELKPDWECI